MNFLKVGELAVERQCNQFVTPNVFSHKVSHMIEKYAHCPDSVESDPVFSTNNFDVFLLRTPNRNCTLGEVGRGQARRLRLIRFGGHLPKGGYDVQSDGRDPDAPAAAPL